MAFIKPTSKRNLERDYGAIFWEASTGGLFGIPKTWDSALRPIYLIEDDAETATGITLDFSNLIIGAHGTAQDIEVLAASFYDEQYFVLVNRPIVGTSGWPSKRSTISRWNPDGAYAGKWDLETGVIAFAVKDSVDYTGHLAYFYSTVNFLAQWDTHSGQTNSPTSKMMLNTMENTISALDLQGAIGEDEVDTWIIVAYPGGRMQWIDITEWDLTDLTISRYKEFGVFGARDISDIAIDRENNVLYVLEKYNQLLTVILEPFGDESDSYVNTPATLELFVEETSLVPEAETTAYALMRDMWDQQIAAEGLTIEFISGAALGEIYNPIDETWSFRQRLDTDENGVVEITYRAKAEEE